MRRLMSIMLAVLVMVSMLNMFAYADYDYEKFMDKVVRTDNEISTEIEKAIEDANKLILDYQENSVKCAQDLTAEDYIKHIESIQSTLDMLSSLTGDSRYLADKLEKLNERMNKIAQDIELRDQKIADMKQELAAMDSDSNEYQECLKKIQVVEENFYKKSENAQAKNDKLLEHFVRELDKIIIRLVDSTNDKANRLIEEGNRVGIEVYSEWVEVEIGGRIILVDPCKTRSN